MSLIDPLLASILVCPVDKGTLEEDVLASRLVCQVCDRRYSVDDGMPNMMIDQAEGGPDE